MTPRKGSGSTGQGLGELLVCVWVLGSKACSWEHSLKALEMRGVGREFF